MAKKASIDDRLAKLKATEDRLKIRKEIQTLREKLTATKKK